MWISITCDVHLNPDCRGDNIHVVRRLLKRNFFLWGEFTKIGCHHVMGNHFLTVDDWMICLQ
ncbi:hypothetical protein OUZ56_020842 [Daphnia magna]|uniref:Uncharacterized protein n=1 Tax=Daphnia magna TaxID=35525 RepID=A0ABQ9ZFL8_9CRUS|nr:hypothetical protein OUZ56_020842 [Daphnia magna]